MFKLFLRSSLFKFSAQMQSIYALKYKIKDITKIKGLATQNPFIVIQGQKIQIQPNKIIAHVIGQSPFYKPNEPLKINFLDNQLNIYNPASPSLALLENSFYVKLNNELYFVANKQSFVKSSYNAQYVATDAPPSLQPLIQQSVKALNKIPQYITPSNLNTLLIKNVLDLSMSYKMQKIRLKQFLKILDTRIKQFDSQIQAINQIVAKKARYRTRIFSSFILAQYALIHYLIYFHLSWDIMEPITVIIGNLDILIGYYFFVFKGREYSLQEIQNNIEEKHKYKYLKKYKFNLQKYEELLELRQIFQARFDLYSKSPFVIMDRFQKPIQLLDVR